jgi:hypothetical protein
MLTIHLKVAGRALLRLSGGRSVLTLLCAIWWPSKLVGVQLVWEWVKYVYVPAATECKPDVAQATEQALASINALCVHFFPWYWYMRNVLRGPSELRCECGNLRLV